MKGITEPLEGKQRASVSCPGVRKNEAIVPEIDEVAETDTTPNKNDVFKYVEEYLTQNIEHITNIFHEGATTIRKAFCKEAAPSGTVITCALDYPGGEQVPVLCAISGKTQHLCAAIPILYDGAEIAVWKPGSTWKSLQRFQGIDTSRALGIVSDSEDPHYRELSVKADGDLIEYDGSGNLTSAIAKCP